MIPSPPIRYSTMHTTLNTPKNHVALDPPNRSSSSFVCSAVPIESKKRRAEYRTILGQEALGWKPRTLNDSPGISRLYFVIILHVSKPIRHPTRILTSQPSRQNQNWFQPEVGFLHQSRANPIIHPKMNGILTSQPSGQGWFQPDVGFLHQSMANSIMHPKMNRIRTRE